MTHSTLALLSSSEFPQHFQSGLDRQIASIFALVDRAYLVNCCYEYPETMKGACDGEPCQEKATVHDLATEQEYCARHFRVHARALDGDELVDMYNGMLRVAGVL